MLFKAIAVVLMLGFFTSVSAADDVKASVKENSSLNLSAEIKDLLKQEMQAVEKGMKQLVSSMATGDWQETNKIAKQIQASYIMKKSLTAEQMKQLHHALPEQFIKLDHAFHRYAGMLAHAAEMKNADVAGFYFYKMNDSCVQCHSVYAQEKFSGFSSDVQPSHKH